MLFAPVLAAASQESPVHLEPLAEGVWLHTSYYTYPGGSRFPSNGLVVREAGGLVLIDTAWGELRTLELLQLVEDEIGLPVSAALVTHAHYDRIAGVDLLRERGIPVYAHPLTRRFALEYGLPVPDRILDQLREPGSTTSLGTLQIVYPGVGHASDNLLVWRSDDGLLYGGCAIRSADAGTVGNAAHGDLASWRRIMASLIERYPEAEMVVPGHGEPGGAELLRHTLELLEHAD